MNFSILQCKCNILSAGNQSEGQHSHKIFHHWQVLLYTFNIAIKERISIDNEKSRKCLFINNANPLMECNSFKILTRLEMNSFNQVKRLWIHSYTHAVSRQTFLLYTCTCTVRPRLFGHIGTIAYPDKWFGRIGEICLLNSKFSRVKYIS